MNRKSMAQFFNDFDTFIYSKNTMTGIVIILAGLAAMAIGQYFYMTSKSISTFRAL